VSELIITTRASTSDLFTGTAGVSPGRCLAIQASSSLGAFTATRGRRDACGPSEEVAHFGWGCYLPLL
jgi:hypothetical protein